MAAGDIALSLIIAANDQASGIIYSIGAALYALGTGNVLGALADAAIGFGIALTTAAKSAGDFQQQITILQTGAGELASNLQTDAQGILDLSVKTASSTSDLTAAMYQINSAGYLGAQGLGVLKAAAEGAKAENANLADVAKALTGVLHDYHIPASDAVNVTNAMLKAVSEGKMKMDEFARSLGTILPVAQEANVSFEDVSAAIGMMTNANIPAQQASRELAYLLRSIEAPSSVATKAMAAIDLSAQQLKNTLSTKGLGAVIAQIDDALNKKFPANSVEAIDALKSIVGGVYGLQSTLAISGQNMAEYQQHVKDIAAALKEGGSNIADWSTIQDEFNFKVGAASAALNVMWITLGQELLPVFGKVVDWVTQIVVNFTEWESKSHFVESALNAIVNALQFLGNILGYVLNVLGQLWDVVAPFFDNIVQAAYDWGVNFVNNFASGIASAFNLVVNIVTQLITFVEDYLGFASPTRKGPGSKADKWGPAFIETLANGMTAHISYLEDAAEQVAIVIHQSTKQPGGVDTSSTSSNKLTASTIKALDTVCKAATSTSKCVSDALTTKAAKAVKDNTAALEKAAATAAEKAADAAEKAAAAHIAKVKKAKAVKPDLLAGVPVPNAPIDQIANTADNIGNQITTAAKKATAAISPLVGWFKNLWQEIQKVAAAIISFLKPVFEYMWNTIKSQLGPALAMLGYALLYLIGDISQLVVNVVGAIVKFVQWLIQIGYFKAVWDGFIAANKGVIETITKVVLIIDNVIIAINKWMTSASTAKGAQDTLNNALKIGQTIFQALKTAADYVVQSLLSIFNTAKQQLIPALLTLWKDVIQPLIVNIVQIVAAIAIWVYQSGILKVAWDALVAMVKISITVISYIITIISETLQPVIYQLGESIKNHVLPALARLMAANAQNWPWISRLLVVIGAIAAVVVGALGALLKGLGYLLAGIIQIIGGVIQALAGIMTVITGLTAAFFDLFVDIKKVPQDLISALTGIIDIVEGLWAIIVGVFSGVVGFLYGLISGFVDDAVKFFQNLYDDLVGHSIIPDLANGIVYWFKYFINLLPTLISTFINKITNFFKDGWKIIETDIITFWTALKTLFSQAWDKYISTPLNSLWNNIKSLFDTAVKNVATWGTNLVKNFADAITAGIHWVTDAATSVANGIKSILGIQSPAQTGPLSKADTWIPNLMNMFVKGISDGVPLVGTAMTNLANGVNGKFNTLTGDVNRNINQIIQSFFGLNTSIQSQTGQINNSLDLMQTAVRGSMEGALGAVQNGAVQIHASSTNIGQDFVQIGAGANNTKDTVSTSTQSIAQDFVKINISSLQTKSGVNESLGSISSTAKSTAASVQSNSSSISTSLQTLQKDSKKFVDDILSSSVSWQTKLQEFGSSIKDLVGVVTSSISSIVSNIAGAQTAVSGFSSATQANMATALANTQSMAAQMNALLGHSVPSKGPLKDDDKWGLHFMQNITSGMQSGIPALKTTTENVAAILSSSIPDEYKTSSISLKANATPPQQNMVIYMQIDGKTIGKQVTKYQQGELRVQGVVRSI